MVVGEHEPAEARAAAEALAAAVANGRVVELAGAGRRGVARATRRAWPRSSPTPPARGAGMTLSGAVAIAGVYEHPTRWAPDKTEFQIMAESAKGALDDAGLTIGDVDALFAASMTMSGMGIVDLAEYLDLKPDYLDGTNIGGSSFVAHVTHAAAAIHAGLCEVALVLYGSTAASNAMAIGTGHGRRAARSGGVVRQPVRHDRRSAATPSSPSSTASASARRPSSSPRSPSRCATTPRSTRRRRCASRSPSTTCSASRIISDPLHLLDCCIISDGGGAVVVTSPSGPATCAKAPVLLLGCGEAVAHQEIGRPDLLTIAARQSGARAFGDGRRAATTTSTCA